MKGWEWESAAAFLAGALLIALPVLFLWNGDSAVVKAVPRDAVTAAAVGGSMIAGGLCVLAGAIVGHRYRTPGG